QNAVDHAFVDGRGGNVDILLSSDDTNVEIRVRGDGSGLPEDFSLEDATGLGLIIVRTFVETDLGGTIEMRRRTDTDPGSPGTEVVLRVPVSGPALHQFDAE